MGDVLFINTDGFHSYVDYIRASELQIKESSTSDYVGKFLEKMYIQRQGRIRWGWWLTGK